MSAPIPLLGWDATRDQWLAARRTGIGASDVATILGLSEYGDTPWQAWADKTGVWTRPRQITEAQEIGTELEPWLLAQAPRMLGMDVTRTPHMLYQHPSNEWAFCSPDAFAADGALVEAKTAKLATYGDPRGWDDDGTPLGYELQARWQMYVMNRNRVYIVALVAGMGRIVRTIDRSLPTELELIRQVSEWRQTHIIEGAEPPVSSADNEALTDRYRLPDGEVIDLDGTNALELAYAYKAARETEGAARKAKAEPGAALKALMGGYTHAKLDNQLLATWKPTRGDVDWQRMAEELAAGAGIELPDPDKYRKDPTRTLLVK